MVTAILREASCERGGRAAILVQYDSIFIEIALFRQPIPVHSVLFGGRLGAALGFRKINR